MLSNTSGFNINEQNYELLSEINTDLKLRKLKSTHPVALANIIQNSKKEEKVAIFEYILYTEIKNHYINSFIEASNYLPKNYFNDEHMDVLLFNIEKDYHVPLLAHIYPKLSKVNQVWVQERVNWLVLSKVFGQSELNELENTFNFIKKEKMPINEKMLDKFIRYQDTKNGLYLEKFIDYHYKLYIALSHFSNDGFGFYAKNYASQNYNQFNYVRMLSSPTNKAHFDKIAKGYVFNSDAELVLAIKERKDMESEKFLLEDNISIPTKTKKIKV